MIFWISITSPFLISDFIDFGRLFVFLISLAKGLSILFIFSKNQFLISLIFLLAYFGFISFISALIFIISFLLLTLGFVHIFLVPLSISLYCLFGTFLLYWSRHLSLFINFTLRMAFAASHGYWIIVFLFSFVSRYFFKFPLWFHH